MAARKPPQRSRGTSPRKPAQKPRQTSGRKSGIVQIGAPDFAALGADRLEALLDAGEEVVRCRRVLARSGENPISELLGARSFYEWDHHPPGDVCDPDTLAQYFYHAHPGPTAGGEHGHFHTFLRGPGMPESCRPLAGPDGAPPADRKDAVAHLVAIGMDEFGRPVSLFTVNRWVTDETWFAAPDVIAMLDRFVVDLARPSWPVNRWITAMVDLFRPQIEALIEARDRVVDERARRLGRDVYDDRDLEVTALCPVDVDAQIDAIGEALGAV